jgi:hypothetical protein
MILNKHYVTLMYCITLWSVESRLSLFLNVRIMKKQASRFTFTEICKIQLGRFVEQNDGKIFIDR